MRYGPHLAKVAARRADVLRRLAAGAQTVPDLARVMCPVYPGTYDAIFDRDIRALARQGLVRPVDPPRAKSRRWELVPERAR